MLFVQYRFQVMDHLGLVAGMCEEPGILSILLINAHPGYLTNGIFSMSHGEAVVTMIINGPWFCGQFLHRFPRFFANKILDRLIRDRIAPEHINVRIPGRALDGLFDPEVSKVYSGLAIKLVRHLEFPSDALPGKESEIYGLNSDSGST